MDESLLECDLIMKGGITSGVVYPSLILQRRAWYRFRSIGSTSAGAMAAAVTAAAELGRDKGGFDVLRDVREYVRSGRNLLELFQPTRVGRPVLDLALRVMKIWSEQRGRARYRAIVTDILWPRSRTGVLLGATAGIVVCLA